MKMKRNVFISTALVIMLLISTLFFSAYAKGETKAPAKTKKTAATLTKEAYKFKAVDVKVTSRKTKIPATIVMPVGTKGETFPLVVMAHGHGGSKDENGGFTAIAEELAAKGIASIRMNFPGCGDSKESFAKNTMINMLEDIKSSREYAIKNYAIDKSKVAIFGYSMGGRLSMISAGNDASYVAAGLLAPATHDANNLLRGVLGEKSEELIKEINKKGTIDLTTAYGQELVLSKAWLSELLESKPLEDFSDYAGDVFLIYGDKDVVVSPEFALAAAGISVNNAKSVKTHLAAGADHGYGFYNPEETAIKADVVKSAVDFFVSKLIAK